VTTPAGCTVCASTALEPHLQVGDAADEAELIPTTASYGHALADIVRCTACGHMQLERFPDSDALARAYATAASEDYVDEEEGQRATARAALERIERYGRPGRILDLGCWVGFLLAEAVARGWEATGVEPSDFAAAYARKHLGLDVRHDDLFTAELPAASFDAVVLGDVIEHLIRPGQALDRIAELLVPEGVLYLALPDSGSRLARALGARWWSVLPTHVQYFTRSSLAELLRRHGYQPLWIGTAPKTFSVRYYLWRLNGYSPAVADALISTARRARVADRPWTPDFHDRMAVVARKAG
jgi:SAM-dependent methyltransferase